MLRSIGKQSGESVESVHEKKWSPITKEIVNHVVFSYSFVCFCADFVGILNLHLFTVFLFYFSVHIHLLCVNKYFYLLIETDT